MSVWYTVLMSEEIEGIDPLTTGKIMYPEEVPSLRLRKRLIEETPETATLAPIRQAHKIPNRSKAEQDEVAKDRVE